MLSEGRNIIFSIYWVTLRLVYLTGVGTQEIEMVNYDIRVNIFGTHFRHRRSPRHALRANDGAFIYRNKIVGVRYFVFYSE